MKCEAVTNTLLEGNLDEVLAADSPVVAHLGTCAACRGQAEHLAANVQALRIAMQPTRARRSADEMTDAVFAEIDREPVATPIAEPRHAAGVRTHSRMRRVVRWSVGALAAAAAVMIVVVGPGDVLVGSRGTPSAATGGSAAAEAPPAPLTVEVPAGRNAVVFEKTKNPDISVVWIY